MDAHWQNGSRTLRRLRVRRGWSWTDLALELRSQARTYRIARIAMAQIPNIRRTIARWEAGRTVPDEQYQYLLALAYARSPLGTVEVGPGSDFQELLEVFSLHGIAPGRIEELTNCVVNAVADPAMGFLLFLGPGQRAELAAALAAPESVELGALEALASASDSVNQRIGSVPFVRLHLAQAAVVDACRRLLRGEQPSSVRARLRQVAADACALAARLAFEMHDDATALALYEDAVNTVGAAEMSRRALIRSSQTMVVYYSTGDVGRATRNVDAAVRDAQSGDSVLVRARAHALQAEMAARGQPVMHRRARAALRLARHVLDADTTGDPMNAAFCKGRLRGFEGVCGIFLGEADAAERQLARSAAVLTSRRESVQRAIVLTDRAIARLRIGGPGAPEAAAALLHECVDLTARTRGRVPAIRLRRARRELGPWRGEPFVDELDDHIHAALIGT
ncbi:MULTISPECIES: hypothetical protein [Actinomadura]|uniref:XRE family transcriptional regulator n=1 Tax=Actinomadura yumaensis TaxID=111807 RepID=A0ABW2D0G0_9ACTN|nr:hypothetical protein [Actinomadura sp. J1-007]MWK35493.1 hypothetical protein [Actinomadura sp. J1-007]